MGQIGERFKAYYKPFLFGFFLLFEGSPLLLAQSDKNVTQTERIAAVSKMVIISPAQNSVLGTCSSAVSVEAQDAKSKPSNVSRNTTIFFTGSSNALKFFRDSACLIPVTSVVMKANTHLKGFYFKGTQVGVQTLVVATYNYSDDRQQETIRLSPSASPSSNPSSAPSSGPSPTPSPSASLSPVTGRAIPIPIYGVTLDRVDNAIIGGEINSLRQMAHFPTARVVFDLQEPPSYYSTQLPQLYKYTYIMGQILDSTDFAKVTVAAYQQRTQSYVQALNSQVDVWEVGNEVNGGWLGNDTVAKIQVAYDIVAAKKAATAITFFYEGEPNSNNCLDSPSNDMFTWISNMFRLDLPVGARNPETEKIRLGLNYAWISWYPDGCPGVNPNWKAVFIRLASIFPNSKVGFGELGSTQVQYGSSYEISLINQFYPRAWTSTFPASYVGGYFWWNFAEEMVPSTTVLFGVLNNAIK